MNKSSDLLHLIPNKNKIKIIIGSQKNNNIIFNCILFIVFSLVFGCFLYYKYKQKNKLNDNKNTELIISIFVVIFFIIYMII